MKLATPFNVLRDATSDRCSMHDFIYKLPKESKQEFLDKEYLDNPTSPYCKVY